MKILNLNEINLVCGGTYNASVYVNVSGVPINQLPMIEKLTQDCIANNWDPDQLLNALKSSGINPDLMSINAFFGYSFY